MIAANMARTPEFRLDRLERIAGLFVKAGLRTRRDPGRMDDKLNILVDYQIQNEERFVRNEKRLVRLAARTDAKFAKVAELQIETEKKFAEVAESQAITDKKFAELINILRDKENGNSLRDQR